MKYYDETVLGQAIICDPPCNYAGEECPDQNTQLRFDTPEITDDEVKKYHLLLGFLSWIHFEKGIYLARFKKGKGFTFDGIPWSLHLEEYLGFDKHLENKPRNERCYVAHFLRERLRNSELRKIHEGT